VVDSAYSGSDALKMLEANIRRVSQPPGGPRESLAEKIMSGEKLLCDYELILTDCSMPFMDGYECCRRMSEILEQAGVDTRPSVVAVTGHVESEYKRKAILSGMEQVYSKPMRVEAMAKILLENRFEFEVPDGVKKELEAQIVQ